MVPLLLLLHLLLSPSIAAIECHVSTKINEQVTFSGSAICGKGVHSCFRSKSANFEMASCGPASPCGDEQTKNSCKPLNKESVCCCHHDHCNK
ncbi:hypothetical protein PENTCL1PPCAC_3290, partial [Pristionchus entomophagus]